MCSSSRPPITAISSAGPIHNEAVNGLPLILGFSEVWSLINGPLVDHLVHEGLCDTAPGLDVPQVLKPDTVVRSQQDLVVSKLREEDLGFSTLPDPVTFWFRPGVP